MPGAVHTSRLLPYALTLGFLGIGALVGLVVATGNLVLIALVIGGLTGILLLNALPVAVWLLLTGVFLINGPVAYFLPELSRVAWLFSLLGVFMSGAALLHAVVGRQRPRRPVPGFVYLAIGFAVLAALAAGFSNGSLAEIGAGAKRQFQFLGVAFLFAMVPFSSAQVRRWLLFLLVVALAQLPFALYQRLVLVPQVMGFEAPGFVPFDIVVGSFEGSMFGGGASSIMAMYLVLAAVGVFCAYRERLIGAGRFFVLMVATVLPLGLGETKVVLLLIPVVLFFAFHDAVLKRPLAFIGTALVTLLVLAGLAYLYFMVQVSGTTTWGDALESTFAYNFGEKGYYGTGVNRLTAIPYWFESQSWSNPVRTLFGHGIGSSYGVDGRVPVMGHMFQAHAGMHIDLVTVSLMLWDFGIVGTLLFFGVLISALVQAARCLGTAITSWDRTLCRLLLAGLGASLLMMFYSASIVVLVSHSFIFALNLGLLAWRCRHGPLAPFATEAARSPGLGGAGGRNVPPRPFNPFPRQPGTRSPQPVMADAGAGAQSGGRFGRERPHHAEAPRQDDVLHPSLKRSAKEGSPESSAQPAAAPLQRGHVSFQGEGGRRHPSPARIAPESLDSLGRIEPVIDSGQFPRN